MQGVIKSFDPSSGVGIIMCVFGVFMYNKAKEAGGGGSGGEGGGGSVGMHTFVAASKREHHDSDIPPV